MMWGGGARSVGWVENVDETAPGARQMNDAMPIPTIDSFATTATVAEDVARLADATMGSADERRDCNPDN